MEQGVLTLLQVAGVGSLQPNTVLVGWSEDAFKQKVFGRAILRILQLKRNLIVFAEPDLPPSQLEPRIDIWWRAAENGSFMLTMAHLLQASDRWGDYPIRVLRIIDDEAGREQTDTAMTQLLRDARIEAEIEIIVSAEPPPAVIARTSRLSEICFFGMALRTAPEEGNPLEGYAGLVGALQGNVFVAKSWHDMEL
jgi:hypothetical protein